MLANAFLIWSCTVALNFQIKLVTLPCFTYFSEWYFKPKYLLALKHTYFKTHARILKGTLNTYFLCIEISNLCAIQNHRKRLITSNCVVKVRSPCYCRTYFLWWCRVILDLFFFINYFPPRSSPLKMKEDDEVDNLDIKLDVKKKSKRVYQSPPPEVGLKISRSLKVSVCFNLTWHVACRKHDRSIVLLSWSSVLHLRIFVLQVFY